MYYPFSASFLLFGCSRFAGGGLRPARVSPRLRALNIVALSAGSVKGLGLQREQAGSHGAMDPMTGAVRPKSPAPRAVPPLPTPVGERGERCEAEHPAAA